MSLITRRTDNERPIFNIIVRYVRSARDDQRGGDLHPGIATFYITKSQCYLFSISPVGTTVRHVYKQVTVSERVLLLRIFGPKNREPWIRDDDRKNT